MQVKRIKFIDLAAQNDEIFDEVQIGLTEIHRTTSYVGGPAVEMFEKEFAEYLGARYAIGVSSGTDALRLALIAAGVGIGDEVITVPMTFIGTAEAIVQTGARAVFVDIDPVTGTISIPALRRYLESGESHSTNGPRAILPVHLYGQPAPMKELLEIATNYGLKVVEDACQAHGALVALSGGYARAGTCGLAGCFSFYPGKNLGAWGEAGAIVTNDSELAARVAWLRDHGRVSHYTHQECGYNARLDSVQAVVLSAKLRRLDRWNARRRELADAYRSLLDDRASIELPREPEYAESCYHLFVIRSRVREALRQALLAAQIDCGIHYPLPLHLQPAFHHYGYKFGDFPSSEQLANSVLSLPMHPHLTGLDVLRVAEVIDQGLRGHPHTPDSNLDSIALGPGQTD